jgi:hypothetical protein
MTPSATLTRQRHQGWPHSRDDTPKTPRYKANPAGATGAGSETQPPDQLLVGALFRPKCDPTQRKTTTQPGPR